MKNIILILFILFSASFVTAQVELDHPKKTTRIHFKKIEVYGKKYDNSIRGLNLFLKDLEKKDPNLHQEMYSEYKNYRKRNTEGNLLIIGGILVGGAIALNGFSREIAIFEDQGDGTGLVVGGLIVMGGGIGFGVTRKIKTRRFIFDFTNKFNEISEVEKMRYKVTPKVGFGNNIYGGLNLNIWF